MNKNQLSVLLVMGILIFGAGCSAKSTVGLAAGEFPEKDQVSTVRSTPPLSKEPQSLGSQLQEIDLSPQSESSTHLATPEGQEEVVAVPKQKQDEGHRQPPVPQEPAVSAVQPVPPLSPKPSPPALQVPTTFTDIFFDFDSARIRPSERSFLQRNARLLATDFTGATLLIEGHCDERGSVEYNLVLGKRRAQVIKNYLIDLGISADRLRIVSYGKERPFCRGHNERCWQLNRRGHFVLQ